jgi:hypothetical protein
MLIEGIVGGAFAYAECARKEQIVRFDSNLTYRGNVMIIEQAPDVTPVLPETLETAIAKDFGTVDGVQYVFTEWTDGPMLVWIAMEDLAPALRRKVYFKQLGIIEGFPEIEFDFNVVSSAGRPKEQLCSSGRLVFSRTQ